MTIPTAESAESGPANAESTKSGPTVREAGIGFILVTIFLDILGIGLIIPVMPELVAELTGSRDQTPLVYGWLMGSYALMQFLFAPLIGVLSDRFGRRPVLLVSLFGLAIDFWLTAWAPSLTWLFVARILSGITSANITAANAYIADVSTDETRMRNFGLVGAMFGIGFVLGPSCGGLIGATNPRLPFVLAGCLAAFNFLYGWIVLPESLPPEKRAWAHWSKLNPLGALAGLRSMGSVGWLAVAMFCVFLSEQCLRSTWILYSGLRFGWGPAENGNALALVGILAAVVQGGLVARIDRWLGSRRTLMVGLVADIGAFIGYGLCSVGWMMLCVMLPGAFGGLVQPAISSLVTRQVPSHQQGQVQGALSSLASLSAIVAPPVATWLFGVFTISPDWPTIPGIAFFVGAGLQFLALMAVLALPAGRPVETLTAAASDDGNGRTTVATDTEKDSDGAPLPAGLAATGPV